MISSEQKALKTLIRANVRAILKSNDLSILTFKIMCKKLLNVNKALDARVLIQNKHFVKTQIVNPEIKRLVKEVMKKSSGS
jgi:hypothetical protein